VIRPPLVRETLTSMLVAVVLVVARVEPGGAHKPITSPYTYNQDVFPILRDRCGRCHVRGGVAPMSLLTAVDTVPWGESIRTEVLAGHMPPGGVDEAPGRFRNAAGLSPREMNLLLTWVTGGTPPGDPDKNPPPAAPAHAWPLGTPDLTVPLPSEAIVAAGTREQTSEFIIPTGLTERRWIRAVDLLPDNAAMVRAATIAVRSPAPLGASRDTERTLALWVPGEEPYALDAGLGFELPPSADLVVRVLYRKTWEYERQTLRDRSTIGLYFGGPSATPVQSIRLAPDAAADASGSRVAFRRTLTEDARAIAIYPEGGANNTAVKVVATRPDGTRADLIAFHPRPDWAHRYWFREPILLPRGTTIQVTATPDEDVRLLPLSLPPDSATPPDLSAIGLRLNVVR
jgi:hypothetical protein